MAMLNEGKGLEKNLIHCASFIHNPHVATSLEWWELSGATIIIPNGRRPFQLAEAENGGVVRVAEPSELFAESGGGRATLPGFSWFIHSSG